MKISFRKATISDLNEMQQLYTNTIQSVCKNDYNSAQIEAWISGVKNTERWTQAVSYTHLRAHETRIGISYSGIWL